MCVVFPKNRPVSFDWKIVTESVTAHPKRSYLPAYRIYSVERLRAHSHSMSKTSHRLLSLWMLFSFSGSRALFTPIWNVHEKTPVAFYCFYGYIRSLLLCSTQINNTVGCVRCFLFYSREHWKHSFPLLYCRYTCGFTLHACCYLLALICFVAWGLVQWWVWFIWNWWLRCNFSVFAIGKKPAATQKANKVQKVENMGLFFSINGLVFSINENGKVSYDLNILSQKYFPFWASKS